MLEVFFTCTVKLVGSPAIGTVTADCSAKTWNSSSASRSWARRCVRGVE